MTNTALPAAAPPAPASMRQHWRNVFRWRPLLLIPLLLGLGFYTETIIENAQDTLEAEHFSSETDNLQVAYNQILTSYERVARVIFDEIIDQPEVLSLFAQANGASEAEQTAVRSALYNLLIADYEQLESLDLRQLHFHLPDNTSFLRFHRPETFGDNLTDVRYTVMAANRDLVPVVGFEEGRIFNGFRYVFPLFWEGEHIGSVETSVSFSAIQADLNETLAGGTSFVLRADVVEATVFEEEQSNYYVSDISATYAYDRAVVTAYSDEDMAWEKITDINATFDDSIAQRMENGGAFATTVLVGGTYYTSSFIAIDNVQGEQVGYVISYQQDDFIPTTRATFTISQAALGIAVMVVIVFFWLLDRNTNFINQQRNLLAEQNTKLEMTNQALEVARRQAESANRLKSQFLANMTHELRTPLNAIINFARFVSEGMMGEVNPQQVDTLGKVNDNGKHLLSLINDLLDISKIEAGQLTLFVEDDIKLEREFNAVTDVARTLLAVKPVELITYIDPELPPITGDRRRIRQIMLNLVSNACKFTEQGSVTIRFTRDLDFIVFSVKDTGPGIAAEDHALIFETFRQTEHGVKQGGTGLGLPISRRLAEIHGGTLTVESTLNSGATFTVRLPLVVNALVSLNHQQDTLVPAIS